MLYRYHIPKWFKRRKFLNGKYRVLLELTFHVNKTFETWAILCNYHMLIRQNSLNSQESDHLGLAFWVVVCGRFDCYVEENLHFRG